MITDITRTLETKLVDYNTFVNFRKSTIILTCLWERSTKRIFGREYLDFTDQLIEIQLRAVSTMEPGIVRKRLYHTMARCVELRAIGHCLSPITVIERIEDVFGKLGMIKGSRRNNLVKIVMRGRLTTRLMNQQLDLQRTQPESRRSLRSNKAL